MELYVNGGCMSVFHAMSEQDVERIMQHPQTMIGSDGGIHVAGEDGNADGDGNRQQPDCLARGG